MLKKNLLPSVTIVIPTFNSGNILAECLESIKIQEYPQSLLFVIIADGGSKDNTLKIIEEYQRVINIKLIHENTGSPEGAKAMGLKEVKSDFFVDIECDNIFPNKNFVKQMVEPFLVEKKLTAAYPWRYTYRKKDTLLNRYFALFGVNDPVPYYFHKQDRQSYLSKKWTLTGKSIDKGDYFLVNYNTDNMPTLGANGFFIKTEILRKAQVDPKHYFHIDVVYDCVKLGYNKFAVVKNDIIHATGEKFGNLFKKRMRYMDELFLRDQERRRYKIYSKKENLQLIKYIILSLTFVEPLIQSIRGFIQIPDIAWFLHPIICFFMTFSYGYVVIKKIIK